MCTLDDTTSSLSTVPKGRMISKINGTNLFRLTPLFVIHTIFKYVTSLVESFRYRNELHFTVVAVSSSGKNCSKISVSGELTAEEGEISKYVLNGISVRDSGSVIFSNVSQTVKSGGVSLSHKITLATTHCSSWLTCDNNWL